ncbi:MAG: hypothetical protein ACLFUR_04380 [Candidatus Hadarchaeia archaeon]
MGELILENIEEVWVAEESNEGITDLPENFYKRAAGYVSDLKSEIGDGGEVRNELLEVEAKEVLKMIYNIYILRMSKISDLLIEGESNSMLEEERIAFEKAREEMKKLSKEIFEPLLKEGSELEPPESVSNILVVFASSVPEKIIGSDMNCYGPFEVGDFANLPDKSAEVFVEREIAKKVKIRESDFKA